MTTWRKPSCRRCGLALNACISSKVKLFLRKTDNGVHSFCYFLTKAVIWKAVEGVHGQVVPIHIFYCTNLEHVSLSAASLSQRLSVFIGTLHFKWLCECSCSRVIHTFVCCSLLLLDYPRTKMKILRDQSFS